MSKSRRAGYIALARGIFEHRLFDESRAFSRLEAWEWMITQAAWKPSGARRGKRIVHLERGQLIGTVRELASAWSWTKSSVARFLAEMVCEGLISACGSSVGTNSGTNSGTKRGHPIRVLTICKYDDFQLGAGRSKSGLGQTLGQSVGQTQPQLPGIVEQNFHQPLNHTNQESSKRSTAQGQRQKPPHRAKGRGMIWLDHGTDEWQLYADDYREARGADKLPENRAGGKGNWFRWLGENSQKRV